MSQMHFYVPDELEARIRARAELSQVSVSRYLADLVKRELAQDWPEGFAQSVLGQWQGEPLTREDVGGVESHLPL